MKNTILKHIKTIFKTMGKFEISGGVTITFVQIS